MKRKNLKKSVVALAGLCTLTVLGGTFAYFHQDLAVVNEFQTGIYKTSIEECFQSPTTWVPGDTTTKAASVVNKGNVTVAVRIKFDETWKKLDNNCMELDGKIESSAKRPGGSHGGNHGGNTGSNLTVYTLTDDTDVAIKNSEIKYVEYSSNLKIADAVKAGASWVKEGDYLYYIGTLKENESVKVMNSVTFNSLAENYVASQVTTVTANGKKTTTENRKVGYDNAKYTLTISAETVQATKAAVVDTFEGSSAAAAIADYLQLQ